MRLENRAAGDYDNEQTPGIIDVVGNIMTFSYGMYVYALSNFVCIYTAY